MQNLFLGVYFWYCLFVLLFVFLYFGYNLLKLVLFVFDIVFHFSLYLCLFFPQNFTHHDVYGHLQNGLPWPRSWTTSCPFPRASPRKFPPLPGGTEKTGSCRTDWLHTSWSGGAALVRSWSWQPRRKWPVPRTDRSRSSGGKSEHIQVLQCTEESKYWNCTYSKFIEKYNHAFN